MCCGCMYTHEQVHAYIHTVHHVYVICESGRVCVHLYVCVSLCACHCICVCVYTVRTSHASISVLSSGGKSHVLLYTSQRGSTLYNFWHVRSESYIRYIKPPMVSMWTNWLSWDKLRWKLVWQDGGLMGTKGPQLYPHKQTYANHDHE
jgi:hypothetical protein